MDGQLALARPATFASATKVNTKSVPAFLNKLYNMVDDPSTDPLIRWSDDGESFLVLDHEHFAREVLGRWFKHQNFASFVRQLNMYGFHKVPQLQQGVLRNDAEIEVINFQNPNFRRGQPDLLCLIHRKKQPPPGDLGLLLEDSKQDDSSTNTPTPRLTNNTGAVLDVKSLINGIGAIKRHQTAISNELKALQQSNQHLWQEAITSRERHKKNEDTINRILRFLAGVFGTSPSSSSPKNANATTSNPVVPIKRARLLIGDGRSGHNFSPTWGDEDTNEDLDLPINLNEPGDEDRFTVLEPQHHDKDSMRLSTTPQPQNTTHNSKSPNNSSSNATIQPDSINIANSTQQPSPAISEQDHPDDNNQIDPTLPDNVLQYISSASPTEMQKLLNLFTNPPGSDIWAPSGLSSDINNAESALTRSPPRLEGFQPSGHDFGVQPSDTWNPLDLTADVSTGGELITNTGLGSYQNMIQDTDDIHSRIDSVGFDINNIINNLTDLDQFTWDLNIPQADPPSEQNNASGSEPQTTPLAPSGSEPHASDGLDGLISQPGQPFSGDPPLSTREGTSLISEVTHSQASSPSPPEETVAPAIISAEKKRKASKPAIRSTLRSQVAKKRRTSK